MAQWPHHYQVDTVDMVDPFWRDRSFIGYDSVFHVAGIAHIKATKKNKTQFYQVNRDLAVAVAKKAKRDAVPHMIFMSSMSVYGLISGFINHSTQPAPKSDYGKSKLEAENIIRALEDDTFKVAILRPPMVYGKGCRGNYQQLARFARTFSVFPFIENKRSMLYIGNLVYFVRQLINTQKGGVFLPQNDQYVCTSRMVEEIARHHQHPIYLTRVFNPIVKHLPLNLFIKVFHNLYYAEEIADGIDAVSFSESIRLTEGDRSNDPSSSAFNDIG